MARRRLRRLSWGLTDQAFSSLTTLCISVAALRGSAEGAAEFAVVFLLHSLAVGFCRSITTEPVAQDLPAWSDEQVRSHVRAAGLTGVGVGLLSALLSAALVRPETALGLWTLAFMLGVVPTDAIRAAWIGARRTARAVPLSSAQLLAAVSGLVAVLMTGAAPWALVPVALVSVVLTLLSVAGGPPGGRAALRPRHWVYAAEWSFTSGLAQSSSLVVTGLGLPLLPLLVRAQGVLFGPLSTLIQAVAALAVPEFATSRRARMQRPALALSFGLVALCGLYSAVALLVPDEVPAALLGSAWASFAPVLPAAAAAIVAGGLSMGPLVALRALGAARSSLGARGVIGILRLVLPVGGALLWGPGGFFWATAVAGVLGGGWAALVLRRIERTAPAEPVGGRS
jgi:hypothetical protein